MKLVKYLQLLLIINLAGKYNLSNNVADETGFKM